MKEHKRNSFSKSQEKHKKVRLCKGLASFSNRLLAGASSILFSICIIASPVSSEFIDGFMPYIPITESSPMGFFENISVLNSTPKIDAVSVYGIHKGNFKFLSVNLLSGMYLSSLWDARAIKRIIKVFRICWHFGFTGIWQNLDKNRVSNIVGGGLSVISNGIGNFNLFANLQKVQFWNNSHKIGSVGFSGKFFKRKILSNSKSGYHNSSNGKNSIYPKLFAIFIVAGVLVCATISLGNAVILLDKGFQCSNLRSKAVNVGFGIFLLFLCHVFVFSLFVFGGELDIF